MISTPKDLQKILLAFRWIVLFTLFILYGSTSFTLSLLIFVSINLLWALLSLFPIKIKQQHWFLLSIVDLTVSIGIIFYLGEPDNPFILYSFLSVLWVSSFFKGKSIVQFTTLFTITSAVMWLWLFYISGSFQHQHHFFLKAISVYVVYLLAIWIVREVKKSYKRWGSVGIFIRTIGNLTSINELSFKAERLIKQLFNQSPVYVCWFNNQSSEDWSVSYYKRLLIDQKYDEYKKKSLVNLQDYLGNTQNFFFFPIISKNEKRNTGAVLISLKDKGLIKGIRPIYLHIISASILNQCKHIKLQQEVENSMKENVRKKMAQDMHDGLAQQLFFLSAQLFQVKNKVNKSDDDHLKIMIDKMEQQVKQCHLEVRDYISYLRDEHQSENIIGAIEQMLNRVKKTTGINVDFHCRGHVVEEIVNIEEVIYRVIEEAVNNSLKHATPSHIDVNLEVTMVQWTIKVKDNGKGMDQKIVSTSTKESFGMIGLYERVESVGGNLFIRSQKGQGTEIVAIIPRGRIQAFV
ncbi:sensor histidine kinase [Bacillus sp. FJAT-45037]|uniref:sensor histidine kinase n=1 Tax=Bacillus sp. FJAT-45037 TaxID=2011007 RepID=UPI000C23D0DC|nr:ATP-binding protein [Bacillus sp. FJAT-45037]